MRATAQLVLLMFPTLVFGQAVTSPAYPQAEQAADAPVAVSLVPREALAALVEAPPPLYARWYVWTGVGATLTAIVVGSVAFALANQHHPIPLTQQQLCGGARCDACIGLSCS